MKRLKIRSLRMKYPSEGSIFVESVKKPAFYPTEKWEIVCSTLDYRNAVNFELTSKPLLVKSELQ